MQRTNATLRRLRQLGAWSLALLLGACGAGGSSATSSAVPSIASNPTVLSAPGGYMSQASSGTTPIAVSTPKPNVASTEIPMIPGANSAPIAATPTPDPQPIAQLTGTMVPVTVNFVMPTSVAQSRGLRRVMSLQSRTQRGLQYVSTSNVSIKVVVAPSGGGPSTYTGTCTTGSCTASFTANPGPNILAFSLTDGAGGTGNVLSSYSTLVIVQPTGMNTYAFTANPVVDSVALQLASPTINAGTPGDVALTINAKDKDGNTIVGSSPYIDVNGNRVSFLLNVANAQDGGRGTITIRGPLRVTAPGQGAIAAHYDGNWLDHATISVTSTSSAVTSLSGTTLTTVPTVFRYYAGAANSSSITAGPDGNIWVTEWNAGCVDRMTPTGVNTRFCSGISGVALFGIVTGPDGNLWFCEGTTETIGKITPQGVVTEYAGLSGWPRNIIAGPDGRLWFTENLGSYLGAITTSGKITEYPVNGGCCEYGIGVGTDGRIWANSNNHPQIAAFTPAGKETDYPVPISGSYFPDGMAMLPDGNIWFIEGGGTYLLRSTPTGTITSYTGGILEPSGLHGIAIGPDGAAWFDQNPGYVGRIATNGTVTEYSLPAGVGAFQLTTGPDGNLWFTDYTNFIDKFVL